MFVSLWSIELCKSRFGLQETETGTAVGLLNGSRDLANFFSSFFIGYSFQNNTLSLFICLLSLSNFERECECLIFEDIYPIISGANFLSLLHFSVSQLQLF
jgi:hypothetical protein